MFLKRAVERTLVGSGFARLLRASQRGSVLILAYHNVVPDDMLVMGDRGLHLRRTAFARQLEDLVETHDVVPLSRVLDAPQGLRPRAAITFDDAYRGAVQYGVPELASRGLPATIFVAPQYLPSRDFWWDVVANAHGEPAAAAFHARALEQLQGRDDLIRSDAGLVSAPLLPAMAQAASEPELSAALGRHPGLTVGSHSWSHPNLARVAPDVLEHEMTAPLDWLARFGERVVRWIAYPYGSSSRTVAAAAARAGYEGGLHIVGGAFRSPFPDRFSLPRLNIPAGLSREGYVLRLAGVRAR